jgi:4'-phosphopantetheinyl transferase EntD
MLDTILPERVAVRETRDDLHDHEMPAVERTCVANAVEKRRREFITARSCARSALVQLGSPPAAIPSGERGEPQWPRGIVGSITHCDCYRAAAVARSVDFRAIGIDAEPHARLPHGVIAAVALNDELVALERLRLAAPEIHWDRLLFSAKESVYKAWYPLARRWLGFEDAKVTFDFEKGDFEAELLLSDRSTAHGRVDGFSGRWMVEGGLVLTAIASVA